MLHLWGMNTDMPKISRQQMWVELQSDKGKPFLIKFIAASDGRLCTIERAVYGGQKRHHSPKGFGRSVAHSLPKLKEGAKIPMTNLDAPEDAAFRSPFASHMIQFNGYRVMH